MIQIISMFDFDESKRSFEEWERYYLEEYVHKLRAVPGLRQYLVGVNQAGGDTTRRRVATLIFDDMEAFQAGMSSEDGQESSRMMNEMSTNSILFIVDADEVPAS